MADVRTLPDAQNAPEAPPSPEHVTTRREDYRPPDWFVPEIRLEFDLDAERTHVRATMSVQRNGHHDRPLELAGSGRKLLSVLFDGQDGKWRLENSQLVVDLAGNGATVETEVEISPAANTKLM